MANVTNAAFEFRRPQVLPSPVSRFALGDVALTRPPLKLDKYLQDDKERYLTSHRNRKRDGMSPNSS